MSIETVQLWHERARPNPDADALRVQLGCHLEELVEMMDTFECINGVGNYAQDLLLDAADALQRLSEALKTDDEIVVHISNRSGFLDSIADQVVTGVGVGHCARMKTAEAIDRVNASNWSKFVDGQPVFNEQGKIAKGPDYAPPNLEGLY